MIYFASYFALFFALGALIGFFFGYVYRGLARRPRSERVATSTGAPAPAAPAPDEALLALPGMSEALAARLAAAGVSDLDALRQIGESDERVTALAESLRLEDFTVRRWVALAGLQQIDGIDAALASALLRVGVRSVPELAAANADRIQNKLAALNDAESLLASAPSRQQVVEMIARAAKPA